MPFFIAPPDVGPLQVKSIGIFRRNLRERWTELVLPGSYWGSALIKGGDGVGKVSMLILFPAIGDRKVIIFQQS
jgi:hypothetical protein